MNGDMERARNPDGEARASEAALRLGSNPLGLTERELDAVLETLGQLMDAPLDFNVVMAEARGEARGEWLSLYEIARLTGYSRSTIAKWSRSGPDRTEPSWRDALRAMRLLGFSVLLLPPRRGGPNKLPEDRLKE